MIFLFYGIFQFCDRNKSCLKRSKDRWLQVADCYQGPLYATKFRQKIMNLIFVFKVEETNRFQVEITLYRIAHYPFFKEFFVPLQLSP